MSSEFSDLLKEAILRYMVEEDRLLRKTWLYKEPWPTVRYQYNVHETFGVSQEEAGRDIRILINVLRRIPTERRPNLEIWIYDRDPTVPYTDTLAEITIKVEDEALYARAEIELDLPRSGAIRRLERLLRRMGMRGRIRREKIEDLIKKLTRASVKGASSWIKIRKVEFLRRRNELIVVVDFELEQGGHSIASQLIGLIEEAQSPCRIFCNIFAWSGHLEAL